VGVLKYVQCTVTTLCTGANQSVGELKLVHYPVTTLCTGGNQSAGVLKPGPGLCQLPGQAQNPPLTQDGGLPVGGIHAGSFLQPHSYSSYYFYKSFML
jgi:hypothetical protein